MFSVVEKYLAEDKKLRITPKKVIIDCLDLMCEINTLEIVFSAFGRTWMDEFFRIPPFISQSNLNGIMYSMNQIN